MTPTPQFRKCVGEMLSPGALIQIEPPEGYIGFYLRLASGGGLMFLAKPGEAFECSTEQLSDRLPRLNANGIFPITIWAWEDTQALLVATMTSKLKKLGIVPQMFAALREKTTEDFSPLFTRMVDVLCSTLPLEGHISAAEDSRVREAMGDALSFFRWELAEKDGAA